MSATGTVHLIEHGQNKGLYGRKLRRVITLEADEGDPAQMDHMDDLYAAFKKLIGADPEKAKKVLALIQDELDGQVDDEEDDEEPGKKREAGYGQVSRQGGDLPTARESRERAGRRRRGTVAARESRDLPRNADEQAAWLLRPTP